MNFTISDFNNLVWVWIGIAIATFISLVVFNIRAPYGRHSSSKWGRMIDNHWAWFGMELPAFAIYPILALTGPSEKSGLFWLLLGLWALHYSYRTFIFPFKIKTKNKKMPLVIFLSAIFFNGMNGFINGYYVGNVDLPDFQFFSVNIILGLLLYLMGMYINRTADSKLIALRNGDLGYQIPQGWLFKYISCPNHFGEVLEWTGFALVAWNLPAVSFMIWTFCNLVPRALNHHVWYRENFDTYPKNRKAIFPFLW